MTITFPLDEIGISNFFRQIAMLEIGNVSCQIVLGQNITNIAIDGKLFGYLAKSKQT